VYAYRLSRSLGELSHLEWLAVPASSQREIQQVSLTCTCFQLINAELEGLERDTAKECFFQRCVRCCLYLLLLGRLSTSLRVKELKADAL